MKLLGWIIMKKTNKKVKIKKAAAIKYDKDIDQAPQIMASGQGMLAEKILELAEKEQITLYKDPDLVEALVHLEVGQQIPPELYKAVAEILSFVYNLDLSEDQE